LDTLRSARVVTGVGPSVATLFVMFWSWVVDETVTEFETEPSTFAATATTRSTDVVAPLASGPALHETVVVPEHDQPADAVETKVNPVGSGSLSDTSAACDGPLFFTDTVYVTFVPARIGPVCDFETLRSAATPTPAVRLPTLFVRSESGVVDDAVAEFKIEPVAVETTATTMSTVASAPFTNGPCVHVTVVVPPQDQPAVDDDTNVSPLGSGSFTVRSTVSDGPALCAFRLYVTFVPATRMPTRVFVNETSAFVTIVVGPSVAVLFSGVGSGVVVETTTELVTLPVAFVATATTRSTTDVAPFAIVPWVHATVVDPVQDQPGDGDDTNVNPVGNVSITLASAESDGPLFFTEIEYVTLVPATTGPVCDFVTARSELVVIVDGPSVALLLPGVGSPVVEVTDAVLLIEPVTFAASATTTSSVAVAPLAINP
jgi:hypothetical protein